MDADLSVEPTYFENLLRQFELRPRLGLTGGFVYEEVMAVYESQRQSRLLRGACRTAGSARVLRIDWRLRRAALRRRGLARADLHAHEGMGSRNAIPELTIFHLPAHGRRDQFYRSSFAWANWTTAFGTYPLFQFIKCASRLLRALSCSARRSDGGLPGFVLRREPFLISPDLVAYLRQEQADRMRALFGDSSRLPPTPWSRNEYRGLHSHHLLLRALARSFTEQAIPFRLSFEQRS